MKLEADDLTQIREIVMGVVSESQERLARMIAKEVLAIRDELARMRQEEPSLISGVADIKLGYEALRESVHTLEAEVLESRDAVEKVDRRMETLEARVL